MPWQISDNTKGPKSIFRYEEVFLNDDGVVLVIVPRYDEIQFPEIAVEYVRKDLIIELLKESKMHPSKVNTLEEALDKLFSEKNIGNTDTVVDQIAKGTMDQIVKDIHADIKSLYLYSDDKIDIVAAIPGIQYDIWNKDNRSGDPDICLDFNDGILPTDLVNIETKALVAILIDRMKYLTENNTVENQPSYVRDLELMLIALKLRDMN